MRKFLPALVLFLLSPFIAEILLGATPLSNFSSLFFVIPLYGGGALLIRELVRRRGLDWISIALLGVAYAIIEEGLVIQSLFNPTLFGAAAYGGRALDVNWIWTLWSVAYHTVVSISIPILLSELLFPAERKLPWTNTAGLIVVAILYLIGALGIGLAYRFVVARGFNAPPVLMIAAICLVALLAVVAFSRPSTASRVERAEHKAGSGLAPAEVIPLTGQTEPIPAPGWAGLFAFMAFGAVTLLFSLPQVLRQFPLAFIPILLYVLLAAIVSYLLRRWTARGAGWSDRHSVALVLGVLLVVMLDGFFFVLRGS